MAGLDHSQHILWGWDILSPYEWGFVNMEAGEEGSHTDSHIQGQCLTWPIFSGRLAILSTQLAHLLSLWGLVAAQLSSAPAERP